MNRGVMTRTAKPPRSGPVTLIDRLAVAYLSGLIAFITGTLLWLTVAGFNAGGAHIAFLPFSIVLWFSGIMAFLGFLLMENFLMEILVRAWQLLKAMWGFDGR